MHSPRRILFTGLLLLVAIPLLSSFPIGVSQSYTTITSLATITSLSTVTNASTSFVGVGQQTTFQATFATITGTLGATNGTVGCVYDHQGLSSGSRGQNITLTVTSLNPIDVYFLSQAAFQSWLNAGHVCKVVNNAILKTLNVTGSASYTVTLPSDGNYEILVSNSASNARAEYTVVISFGQNAIVNVTTFSTVLESSARSVTLTERFTRTEEIQPFYTNDALLIAAVVVVVVAVALAIVVFKRRSGTKSPKPKPTQGLAASQRFCTNCGAELGPNLKFCEKCGKPVP